MKVPAETRLAMALWHACVLFMLAPLLRGATTNYVTTTNDSGPGSLRQAMLDVNVEGRGTILFSNLSSPITLSNPLPMVTAEIIMRGRGTNPLIRAEVSGASFLRVATNGALTIHQMDLGFSLFDNRGTLYILGSVFDAFSLAFTNSGEVIVLNNPASRRMYNIRVIGSGRTTLGGFVVSMPSSYYGRNHGIEIKGGRVHLERCIIANKNFTGINGIFSPTYNVGGAGEDAAGAGLIAIDAQVSLTDCIVSNNTVRGGDGASGRYAGGGGHAFGAGIYVKRVSARATLAMTNCLIVGNNGFGGRGAEGSFTSGESGTAYGGGIYFSGDDFYCVNCTISGNSAAGNRGVVACRFFPSSCVVSVGSPGLGAGVYCTNGNFANSSIVNNRAAGGIGAVGVGIPLTTNVAGFGIGGVFARGNPIIRSTMIANNLGMQPVAGTTNSLIVAADGSGTFTSLGHNLIGTTNPIVTGSFSPTASFTGLIASDIVGADPRLGPLQDNGGFTFTHALLAGSAAIDAGTNGGISFDQRGQPRTIDDPAVPNAAGSDGTDIGALEVNPVLTATESRKWGSDIQVRFTTVSDKTYRVQYKADVNSAWTTLPESIAGTGGIVTYTDIGAASLPRRFYQMLSAP